MFVGIDDVPDPAWIFNIISLCIQLMVATALVLLCTRPLEVGLLGQVPWLLTVPAIAIIGREVSTELYM